MLRKGVNILARDWLKKGKISQTKVYGYMFDIFMTEETTTFNDVIEFIETQKMHLATLCVRTGKDPNFKQLTERINSVIEVYDEIIQDLEQEFGDSTKQPSSLHQ